MELFAQYIMEREGKQCVYNEHGFATYVFFEDFCYIEDIFVVESCRKSGVASALADLIVAEAKEKGYKKLLGTVCPTAKNSTNSLKVLLAYGFNLKSSEHNLIWFTKEI